MKAKRLAFPIILAFIFATISSANVVSSDSTTPGRLTFTSPQLGISFAYPEGWTVDAPSWEPAENRGYGITLYPPEGDPRHTKIDIVYLGFEIEAGQDLQTWSKMYSRLVHGGGLPEPTMVDRRTIVDPDGNAHQLVHKLTSIEGRVQAVLLSSGRLVLCINAYTHDEIMTQVLKELVASITFAPDAPQTFNELNHTNKEYTSLEVRLAEITAGGVEMTCDLVCQDAEASRNLKPGTPEPPTEEYLEQERKYLELLKTQNPLSSIGSAGSIQVLGTPPNDRKSLPSNWLAPIVVTNGTITVLCGSVKHTGRAAMAIDIGVGIGTHVYAAQYGMVMSAGWDNTGYGYLIRIATDNVLVANQNRMYWHNYAHLKEYSLRVSKEVILSSSNPSSSPSAINLATITIGSATRN